MLISFAHGHAYDDNVLQLKGGCGRGMWMWQFSTETHRMYRSQTTILVANKAYGR